MNSISLDVRQNVMDQFKENKSVKLYESAAETKGIQHETINTKKLKKNNIKSTSELNTSKCSRSPNESTKKKINKTLDLSHIEAVKHNKNTTRDNLDNSVKSIKNKSENIDSVSNVSNISSSNSKPKKRNKSVSFMLDEADETVVKKSKSDSSSKQHKKKEKEQIGKEKEQKSKEKLGNTKTRKNKKKHQSKENQNMDEDMEYSNKENVTLDATETDILVSTLDTPVNEEIPDKGKKKVRKCRKRTSESVDTIEEIGTGESSSENRSKKLKKKKHKVKTLQEDNTDTRKGEPATKIRKKDLKPEVIAKGLENLNIGDNAHTLTNLLDEMTVVDKNTNKKKRQQQKRNKLKKSSASKDKPESTSQQENVEKEKVKWNNRKWNKDVKGDWKSRLHTSVVVENLPIKIMCNYKKLLSEHFSKFGTVAGIGVAEAYPTEDLKPVFTTTVYFQEEDAIIKVLEEDNSVLAGNRIRVRRPRPPTETTLVVRAYGLSDQALSSLFSAAGRVRAIRQLVKGKKCMPTAFVEFDGPEAVERALTMAEDAKINGKKMYVTKFEVRKNTKNNSNEKNTMQDDDNSSIE